MTVELRRQAYYRNVDAHDEDVQHLSSTAKFLSHGAKGGAFWDMSQPFSHRFGECLKVVSSVLSKPHPESFTPKEDNAFLAPWFTTKRTYINHVDYNTTVRPPPST